ELLGAESGSPFGAADLIADLDAYNIFWILSINEEFIAGTGGIAAGIEAYFNSLGSSADPAAQRTHNFADVRLYDADYTREAYRAAMYYQYYFDTYQLMGSLINVIEMVEVTEGLRNYTETLGVKIPTQGLIPPCTEHHILAAVYAFADYLYESRIAPAPDDGDITIDYTNETIKVSAANAFRVSATIEAAPDDDDGEPDEVTVTGLTEVAVTAKTDESEGGTIELNISDSDSITEFIGKTLYARRLPYGGYLGESAAVPIAIPARPTPPENGAIEIAAMTHLSAALTLPNGIEYSIDDGKTWREASSLSELTPETTYVITARYKATADAFRSDAAAVCEFTTPKAPQVYNPPYDPYIPPAQSSATPVGDKNEPLRGEVSKEVIASFTHSTANGTATITISDSETKRIIDSAATTAVFDLSGARGVDSAVLPMDTVRSFAAAGVGVTLKTENGDLALDAAAISTAALDTAARVGGAAESDTDADGGVALTIKTTAGESGSVRLTLQLRAGDNEVTAFGGGHARVSIPFTLPDGVSPARVVPYRDDGGTLTLVRGGYNAEAGRVELRLEHFSEYIIKINDVRYAVSGGWHDDSLDYAAQRGLLDEFMQNGVIDAGQGITREAFIATYMKAAGIEPLTAFNAAQFTDVDSNSPSAAYIRTARELGIVSGVGDGKFDPSLPAVRAHFFQVMYNTLRLGLTPVPNTDTGAGSAVFSDADTLPNWVRPAVDELVRLGFLLGDEGSLSADEHFTIGTMCAAVKRLCE
ncbi:MAG: S-layer homology domain-containing protein, partial [Oscillospiraceae bacterium]|nr:S-layer homology domain-containing protein [Oscillospiraceae bacterium]